MLTQQLSREIHAIRISLNKKNGSSKSIAHQSRFASVHIHSVCVQSYFCKFFIDLEFECVSLHCNCLFLSSLSQSVRWFFHYSIFFSFLLLFSSSISSLSNYYFIQNLCTLLFLLIIAINKTFHESQEIFLLFQNNDPTKSFDRRSSITRRMTSDYLSDCYSDIVDHLPWTSMTHRAIQTYSLTSDL